MIDHTAARRLAATAIDWTLAPTDAGALADHLGSCSACRADEAALRREARGLAGLPVLAVPDHLRQRVLLRATARPSRVGGWTRPILALGILLAALWGIAVGAGGRGGGPDLPPAAINWQTEVVRLQATGLAVVAGDRTFVPPDEGIEVHSDPGNASSWTLEVTWRQAGTDMRFNLYFEADGRRWWVREARAYDGAPAGEWAQLTGAFPTAALGSAWTGTLRLDGRGRGGPVAVIGEGVRIEVNPSSVDGPAPPPVDPNGPSSTTVVAEVPPGGGAPVPAGPNPFLPGGALYCSGILQGTPAAADARLRQLGYKISWRLVREGRWDEVDGPPDGVIPETGALVAGNGLLVIPVIPTGQPGATPAPMPSDCPID